MSALSDKAGGNKFATDFEDGSLKLQEFVVFMEKELKTGPPLLEALGNADIFYEMQYKEVKIVANVSLWIQKENDSAKNDLVFVDLCCIALFLYIIKQCSHRYLLLFLCCFGIMSVGKSIPEISINVTIYGLNILFIFLVSPF